MKRKNYKDDQEYTPAYKANQEWSKTFKFNKQWYHLSSLYDRSEYDFNQPLFDDEFDFNMNLFEKD